MRDPEEIQREHGERVAARAAINNTPFDDEPEEPDYTYEVVKHGGSFRIEKVITIRTPIAAAVDLQTADLIVYALEQYEGV